MKLRITPLNIIGAGAAVTACYLFLNPNASYPNININGLVAWGLGILVVVTFVTDLVFRFALKDLKRIWIIESIFLVITVILIVIIQKVR
ncbi:hypothetical protein GJU39_04115 [Pedobacter petrophilus]|uniref:Uncharacterized protein n=1 Tax=Pedobacter petrophilus TaxID=1908241 RepID=A0A7K0FUK1_9SPHI|nr:hypothetical protein [Pedobacter petrophilus]MRX75265.1 hypothetical protein [Pedobacter petrophilus]